MEVQAEAPERESEFGAGVVVCLAKFSEHLWNRQDPSMGDRRDEVRLRVERKVRPGLSEEEYKASAYSSGVEMWANGASDHFFDLDKERAPTPLRELAELTLKMGHGFTGQLWTEADMARVRELWRESCLAIDSQLGAEPIWGQW